MIEFPIEPRGAGDLTPPSHPKALQIVTICSVIVNPFKLGILERF
jgi:hypothetical protein